MQSLLKKIGRLFLSVLLGAVIIGMVTWSSLAVYYSNLPWQPLRAIAAVLFAAGSFAVLLRVRPRWRARVIFAGMFAAVVIWWNLIPPSNDRDWKKETAVLSSATVNGNKVTIHHIRHLDYRTESDFTPRYYDKTFDLSTLDSVDLIAVYWGSDAIAHVMVSFGFAGKDYVCFSIERRDERGESYSTWKGLFHQYELFYVVADERDVIGVRTRYRQPEEQVYLFRTRIPLENQRALFLSYLQSSNRLAKRPEWYNTITDNCTTGVLLHTRAYRGIARYNWKILLSGYTAEYAYEIGGLDTSLPFEELRRRGHVNERARAAIADEDFSQKIREGMPMPPPATMDELLRKR